jgi:hypothetical protein
MTGAQGPAGPQGPHGVQGIPGPAGPGAPPIGFLTITKNVVGDPRPASDFVINIEGNNPSKTRISGSTEGVDVILGEGHYRVTEQPITGYTTSYSEGCEGDITSNSQRESCVITNTGGPATLIVTKFVRNEGCPLFRTCPNASPADFSISVNGQNPVPRDFRGSAQGTTVTLNPGNYNVFEGTPSGEWDRSFSQDCSGTIFSGQIRSCTITNTGHLPPN